MLSGADNSGRDQAWQPWQAGAVHSPQHDSDDLDMFTMESYGQGDSNALQETGAQFSVDNVTATYYINAVDGIDSIDATIPGHHDIFTSAFDPNIIYGEDGSILFYDNELQFPDVFTNDTTYPSYAPEQTEATAAQQSDHYLIHNMPLSPIPYSLPDTIPAPVDHGAFTSIEHGKLYSAVHQITHRDLDHSLLTAPFDLNMLAGFNDDAVSGAAKRRRDTAHDDDSIEHDQVSKRPMFDGFQTSAQLSAPVFDTVSEVFTQSDIGTGPYWPGMYDTSLDQTSGVNQFGSGLLSDQLLSVSHTDLLPSNDVFVAGQRSNPDAHTAGMAAYLVAFNKTMSATNSERMSQSTPSSTGHISQVAEDTAHLTEDALVQTPTSRGRRQVGTSALQSTPATKIATPSTRNRSSNPPGSNKSLDKTGTQHGALCGAYNLLFKESPDADIRMPKCELGAIELLTFFPNHTQWPNAIIRLRANGWSPANMAKAQLFARGKTDGPSFKTRDAAMRHQMKNAGILYFNDKSFTFGKYENDMKGSDDINASDWKRRGPYQGQEGTTAVRAPKLKHSDLSLRDVAEGVVHWPGARDAGVFTQCMKLAIEREEDYTIADIPDMIEDFGFSMPAAAKDCQNWDRSALGRFNKMLAGQGLFYLEPTKRR